MMGLVPLQEEEETRAWLSAVGGYSKKAAVCKLGRRRSPDTEAAGTWNSDLPASRTVRNLCLVFKPSSLWYFVIVADMTKTETYKTSNF